MHPLLPKLKEGADNKVAIFKTAGVWDPRQAIELDTLSESLDVEKIDPKYFDIDCVPDMWARPLLFEMALYDTNHLLHPRILGEWRGLLAMLALKEWRNLTQLRVMRVQIPPEGGNPATTDFPGALRKLIPQKTLSSDTPWDNLYVILFGVEPIGITSPTTLVCTAADYYNRIQNVTWFDGRFLFDPTPQLGKQEKTALASWLKQLVDNLKSHQGLDQSQESPWNALLGLLNQFQADLGGVPAETAALSESDFGLTKGIFRYLDRPVGVVETYPSHVQLRSSRTTAPPLSLLVVDKTIPQQWNMSNHEVFVWGTTTLASFPFAGLGSNRTQLGSTPLPQNVQLRLPEDFFTKKLFVIEQQDAFPGTMSPAGANFLHQGRAVTPIIPIKAELLDYLSPNELRNRIQYQATGTGVVVTLRLTLSGADGVGKEMRIKREFRFQENEVISIPSVPVLEIWPNFKASNWKVYYTYFSTTGETTFYAEPYVLGETPVVQTFENSRNEIERQITRTRVLPEVMKCKFQVADTQTGDMKSEEAGVLLITQPQQLPKPTKSLAIGVDFGTSSTNVYASDNNRGPFPVRFEQRFLKVTETATGGRRTCLYDDFLPGNPENTPFLTIFHDFQKATAPPWRPLLDGHIYFLLDYKKFDATRQEMAIDLKWSEDPMVRHRTQAFLAQLCLQCSAEAVVDGAREVSWRFSFPTAFSAGDLQEFRDIWRKSTEACTSVTGLAQSDAFPIDEPESLVSAQFFAEHPKVKAPFAIGAVCIDIGGGTSDLSIWQDNQLRWQTSLRFAGRNLFLDLLYENPGFLRIFQVDPKGLQNLKDTNRKNEFYAQADTIIAHEGDGWLNILSHFAGVPSVKGLVQLIAIGLSGLYYYIGLLLRHLSQSKGYKARMPSVYIAGNGAKMFHWLAVGNYDNRSPINALFKEVLSKASGFPVDPKMEVKISPLPKAEAAFGLVSKRMTLDYDQSAKVNEVLAGEVFIENKIQFGWDEILTAEKLKKGLDAQWPLDRFEDFVQIFDTYAKSPNAVVLPIAPDPVLMGKIHSSLSQTLADFKAIDEKDIHVEPLFISALKTLLEIKTDEWASNNP